MVKSMTSARQLVDAAARKLEMLSKYRDDYLGNANRGLEPGFTDPVRMLNARAFIDKLDAAITQQQREVDGASTRAATARNAVQAAEVRLKSLETLRDRRNEVTQRIETRREQGRSDAQSARMARDGGASLEMRPA